MIIIGMAIIGFPMYLGIKQNIKIGLGGGTVNEEGVFYLRAGFKTKKSFFITSEMLTDGDDIGFGVGLGFSFGGKLLK